MKRVMVNLDNTLGQKLEKKAAEQRRSISSYVGLLIEADLVESQEEKRIIEEAKRLGINVRAELTAIVQRAEGPNCA